MNTLERRTQTRQPLRLAARVVGHRLDRTAWDEMATTEDASASGCALVLRHSVTVGQVLHLSLPLPQSLRQNDLLDADDRVFALVRYVNGPRVGVTFLGKHAPTGFVENPGGILRVKWEDIAPLHVREYPRFEVVVDVRLRRLNPLPGETEEEGTTTEVLGLGGAGVLTRLPIQRGELVELRAPDGVLTSRAEVVALSTGRDGRPRLNLRFLDPQATRHVKDMLERFGILVGPRSGGEVPSPLRDAGLKLSRGGVFRECRSGDHASCIVGVPSSGHFFVCACRCHGTASD
jgi:hypothetical protein